MEKRELVADALADEEDWYGNNAAFRCPLCGGTFIVSGHLNKNGRECPRCGESTGFVDGGSKSGGHAWIEW
jgi:hypothetical protein